MFQWSETPRDWTPILLDVIKTMGDLIFAIFVTLVTVMIISYSNGIDKNCLQAFVQSKTVVLYYYFRGITNQFLVANTVTFPRNYVEKSKSNSLWWLYTYQTVWIHDCIITCISDTSKLLWLTTILGSTTCESEFFKPNGNYQRTVDNVLQRDLTPPFHIADQ